jgi:hypothetical protein
MDTTGLIDNRNLELWNSLRNIHEIEIIREQRSDYLIFSKNTKTIIYVPFDNLNTASFTHELLHIYLRTKEIFIGRGLRISIKESNKLSKIISDSLIDHIANCLEHVKILPEFIKLGYKECDFISDYSINKLTNKEVEDLSRYFKTNFLIIKIYKASAIRVFIGKYIAVCCCPNKNFNYEEMLVHLKYIDPNLFQILETFLIAWNKFDYKDKNPKADGYNSFINEFIENLKIWIDGKIIKY